MVLPYATLWTPSTNQVGIATSSAQGALVRADQKTYFTVMLARILCSAQTKMQGYRGLTCRHAATEIENVQKMPNRRRSSKIVRSPSFRARPLSRGVY